MKYSKFKISAFFSIALLLGSVFVIAFFADSARDETKDEVFVQDIIQQKMSQVSPDITDEKKSANMSDTLAEEKEECRNYIGKGADRVCIDNVKADKRCYTYTVEVNGKELCKDRDFYFTAASLEDFKDKAYNALLESYQEDMEFEYFNSYPAEIIPLKNTNKKFIDQYVIVMRDNVSNKITAISGFHVTETNESGLEYIGWNGNSPTSAAFKPGIGPTGITLEQMQKSERDLDAPFPKIDESGAKEILSEYLKDIGVEKSNISHNGYAIVMAPHPQLNWYGVNTYRHPFHEFTMNGEHFWVNGEDGQVFDEPRIEWIGQMNQKAYDNPDLPQSFWDTVKYDPKEARKQK